MSAEGYHIYACPKCKGKLEVRDDALHCPACKTAYPIVDRIPDFLLERPQESSNPILRNITRLDKLARIYETKLWYPLVINIYGGRKAITFEGLIGYVREKMKPVEGLVLDVATGPGTYGRRVAAPGRTAYGIDLSMGMLRMGQKYVTREGVTDMHFSRANVEQLPFRDQLFDGALTCGSLHLFPDTVKALREIGRTMKPGAPLAVFTFTPGNRGILSSPRVVEHIRQSHQMHIFEILELEEYLTEAGFEKFTPNVFGSVLTFSAQKPNA